LISALHRPAPFGLNTPAQARRAHVDADWILLVLSSQRFDAKGLRIEWTCDSKRRDGDASTQRDLPSREPAADQDRHCILTQIMT
ncbi:MAG: hypothetical protein M3P29_09225, partial [Acidobacteriota bacterium]|nr:hypothetical protein [Acidobacteriota bacterium]